LTLRYQKYASEQNLSDKENEADSFEQNTHWGLLVRTKKDLCQYFF